MDREGAVEEEPSSSAPSSTHTAFDFDTTSNIINNLYIDQDDLLAFQAPTQTATSTSLHPFDLPQTQTPPDFAQSNCVTSWFYPPAAESTASTTMSRKPSSQGSKSSQQYQLMSSESPADQARSLSQVSPGFIFVIFLCPALLLLHSTPSFP